MNSKKNAIKNGVTVLVYAALKRGFAPFFRNKFPGLLQDFSRTQIDFSRALKFSLTPHSQDHNVNSPYCLPYTSYLLQDLLQNLVLSTGLT